MSPQTGTCCGFLPSIPTRIKSCAAADFQHPMEEFMMESRNMALCAPGNRQDRSLDGYIQELIIWAQILRLLISREALKSFMVTIVSCDQQKLQVTSWIFLQKNTCLLAWTPLYKYNHIYTLLFLLPLQSSLSELCEMLSLWLQSSYLPQIKLNSQISCSVLFLSRQYWSYISGIKINWREWIIIFQISVNVI